MTLEEKKQRKKDYDRKRYLARRDETRRRTQEYYHRTKEDRLKRRREYYQETREHTLEVNRRYREKNKERLAENARRYVASNREARRAYMRKYVSERKAKDPAFKVAVYLRTRLYQAIKAQGEGKTRSIRDLGCSIPEFLDYIEEQFVEGMSWDNHGGWHLDHVKPLASFDLTDPEELKRASHYSNYQPLWAAENIKKGGRE